MRVTLTVTEGPNLGKAFAFDDHDTFLVGRSPQAHFHLPENDRYFSRLHFLIEVNPPLCRLLDLGSHNGTYVNGARVSSAELGDGDRITAGQTVVRVALEGTLPPPAETFTLSPPAPGNTPCMGPGALTDTNLPVAFPGIPGYRIEAELGRGGMGVVYKAAAKAEAGSVALKIVLPKAQPRQNDLRRFLREADILRQLKHPHIVAFREVGEAAGQLFFAMDYVRGIDAARLLREQGPLPIPRAVRLTCQLLDALAYAHAKGFVHRDIKPANLLVTEVEGQEMARLADFGLARAYQASQLSGLTMLGQTGGTVEFMAPEQITNFRAAKPPADQYAGAATLYNLLTGQFIMDFPREVRERLLLVLQAEPVPIQSRRSEVPPELAQVIHRALAREPEKRFPDAAAMRQALLRWENY
jgi:eukaryotic-like serine/threonine-protein kinase